MANTGVNISVGNQTLEERSAFEMTQHMRIPTAHMPSNKTTSSITRGASWREHTQYFSRIPGSTWRLFGCGSISPQVFFLIILAMAYAHVSCAAKSAVTPDYSSHTSESHYSQPLLMEATDDNSFRPIIPRDLRPEDISRKVFTEAGQYRVFQPVESDLRLAVTIRHKHDDGNIFRTSTELPTTPAASVSQNDSTANSHHRLKAGVEAHAIATHASLIKTNTTEAADTNSINEELRGVEELLVEYVENFFSKGKYEPIPGLIIALQKNATAKDAPPNATAPSSGKSQSRKVRQAEDGGGEININFARALETGRLFFFTGLKKILWPIFMGLQILKSLLLAMLLPTILSSFGKLLGKGIASGSVPLFVRPMEPPQDLDFKDASFSFDDDGKFVANDDANKGGGSYAYNQPEASQTQNQYVYNAAAINQQALSRYGMNEQQKMQDSYLSALQSISSASFKNSNSISGSLSGGGLGGGMPGRQKPVSPASMNNFQSFQKVPATSLLLSNYDPFYSPLLSRLDSVFAQLKLNSENEVCREKLICLMYANPAKYAPYSNLVSAQLSRELNELRKPTSDNPDILRFFKYMRAAKDGQDGVDCEKAFDTCKEFKDFENPAMVSTYHDINKLVQARKMA